MKYAVKPMNGLSWIVEKEDGTEYIVNFNIFKNKFTCNCVWFIESLKPCRHIRMIKENIIKGRSDFDE